LYHKHTKQKKQDEHQGKDSIKVFDLPHCVIILYPNKAIFQVDFSSRYYSMIDKRELKLYKGFMKRILVLALITVLLTGCAAWKRFTHPPKKCTTSCDIYGNCTETCRKYNPNETCTPSCDVYGNCEEVCK